MREPEQGTRSTANQPMTSNNPQAFEIHGACLIYNVDYTRNENLSFICASHTLYFGMRISPVEHSYSCGSETR